MKTFNWLLVLCLFIAFGTSQLFAQQANEAFDRTVLPIPEPNYPPYKELDVRNATPPPRFEVKAPDGAPNVIIVLVDDLGFAGTSTFGGPVTTPTFDRLAGEGIFYNNFLP